MITQKETGRRSEPPEVTQGQVRILLDNVALAAGSVCKGTNHREAAGKSDELSNNAEFVLKRSVSLVLSHKDPPTEEKR